MNVRRITKADFDRVVEVIDHWWGGPISTFAHPIFFYELGDESLVVEQGSDMIGFLLGFVAPGTRRIAPAGDESVRTGYVHLVGIHPDYRRRGVGRLLYDRFIDERLIARLTSLFGLLALLLAAIGLYGVTAYTVVRRTPEIGVRMALGAGRSHVIGTVMRGAMLQAVIGLAIGIPVAVFCVRYVKSQLYDITRVNAPVMIIAIGVLALAAAIAGIIPAQRAASIDPVRALRTE